MTVARAPGKAILLGEHFVVHGTGAILCAIDKYATVTVSPRDKGVYVKSRYGELEFHDTDLKGAPEHHRPFLNIATELGMKVDTIIDSQIPPGVGLGSSSSCCVAGAGAMLNSSRDGVIETALRAERSVFEGASGADTAVCTVGGIIEFRNGEHKVVESDPILLAIASTGRIHSTAKTVEAVRQYRERNPKEFESACKQVKGLVGDARNALDSKDLVSLGAHMWLNQELLKEIKVSDATIDKIVEAASRTSYGAKLTGAGAGGCVIALVDDSNCQRTLEAMRACGAEAFSVKTDMDGLRVGQTLS